MTATATTQEESFQRLHDKFFIDMHDLVKLEKRSERLTESGQPRVALRGMVAQFMKTAVVQLSVDLQVRLSLFFAGEFFKCGEYNLAIESYDFAISKCEGPDINDALKAVKEKTLALQSIVRCNLHELNSIKYCYIAPMTVSKLLQCLQKLRLSMDSIFALSVKQQEDYAWLVLNSAKLILEVSQPLVWLNCGKYVTESVMFAAICMESVINLCTVRHMQFRMKLYGTAFYSALGQGTIDEAAAILQHASNQCNELKTREELDPPVPEKTVLCIEQCNLDLAVMKFSLAFWKDSDTLNFSPANLSTYYNGHHPDLQRSFLDICVCESIRLHYLTSGNRNENYRKRSANIVKAAAALFSTYQLPGNEINDSAPQGENNLAKQLTLSGLFEILCVVVIDFADEPSEMTDDLVAKIYALAQEVFEANPAPTLTDYKSDINLLERIYSYQRVSANLQQKFGALRDLLTALEDTMFSERAYRKKSFLKRILNLVWQKFLYPSLQTLLSDFGSQPIDDIYAESLILVMKTFDATFIEDPVLYGTLALVSAQVLRQANDLRQSISLLRQSISVIEEHRAASIDVAIHMPDDSRDVLALQRASFSARAESQDWYHSVRRLGAQAFAGYGIFGTSSNADRTAQALAEIHTDLLSLYFRSELEYSIQLQANKNGFRASTANNKILNANSPTKTVVTTATLSKKTMKGGKTIGKTGSKTAAQPFATAITSPEEAESGVIDVEKLHAAHFLKSFCLRNGYARCLLYLEMARCQRDDEEKCLDCLHEAMKCIEEVEGREQLLKTSFSDHTILTDSNTSKYPLVLARSHNFIYVAPVGCRKLSRALYYRVLAKEKGSGTAVSIYNDDFAGCEKQIFVENMNHPTQSAVKIGPLRPGELYMFGHVAFNSEGKTVGSVSPSTPVVEAVNPLPTILLWQLLNQTAEELSSLVSSDRLYREASLRVCSRFFLNTPVELPPLSIGKGINLFLFNEASVAMLPAQQSSPVLIQAFILSFLSYEIQAKRKFDDHGKVNWNMRVHSQIEYLKSLHRVAAVTRFAVALCSHDLTLRCVHFGYLLAVELLRFDSIHLAFSLQNPLTIFAVALQSIPKRNWQELEHSLYCRVVSDLITVSALNTNLSPVVFILSEFYPEALSDKAAEAVPPPALIKEYAAVVEKAKANLSMLHISPLLSQAKELFANDKASSTEKGVGSLWQMDSSARFKLLEGKAVGLVGELDPTSNQLIQQLNETPQLQSDFFIAIQQLCGELVAGGKGSEIPVLLQRCTLFEEFTSPQVREIHDTCKLKLLTSFAAKAAAAAEAEAAAALAAAASPKGKGGGGGAAKGGKNAPKVEETPPPPVEIVPEEVPKRFAEFSGSEIKSQTKAFGSILLYFAVSSFEVGGKINQFPVSSKGPYENLDPNDFTEKHSDVPESTQADEKAALSSPLLRVDFIRYIAASIQLFSSSNDLFAAVFASVKLFNFVTNDWIDPEAFSEEFKPLKTVIFGILSSLVEVLERNANTKISFDNSQSTEPVEANPFSLQELKESMLQLRDLLVYLLKVNWLQKDFQNVVTIGSRIFNLFHTICPEYTKVYGDACLPLVVHSQEQLVAFAQAKLDEAIRNKEDFIFQYEEAQKKKRKKKLRVARTEKDEEELLFDAQTAELQGKINEAEDYLLERKRELDLANSMKKTFETMNSQGSQMLDKARQLYTSLLISVKKEYGNDVDYKSLLEDAQIRHKYEQIMKNLSHVVNFLREKKDRVVLVEALKCQSDLMLLFGDIGEARKLLHDLIDGLFNSIDACVEWPKVCERALASLEGDLVACIVPSIAALGKLSKFCASSDWDAKAGYCRMAAELIKIPFSESVGHPSTTVGYAAYTCLELGGVRAFSLNSDALSAQEVIVSLDEIIRVLIAEEQFISALPVIVFMEYLCAVYLCSPTLWLKARCYRISCLIASNLFAETVSMFANIESSIVNIQAQSFVDLTRKSFKTESENLKNFETGKNAFNFYSAPPFFNNLPPNNEEFNLKATKWVGAYTTQFEQFSNSLRVNLPVKEPTKEEREEAEREAARLALEAAEVPATK